MFAPEAEIALYELFRVIEGRKDIVKVDAHPGSQSRHNPQQLVEHIAVHGDHVARIDEQQVAFLQLLKDIQRHLLHTGLDQLRQSRQAVFQEPPGMRLNRRELSSDSLRGVDAHRARQDQS